MGASATPRNSEPIEAAAMTVGVQGMVGEPQVVGMLKSCVRVTK